MGDKEDYLTSYRVFFENFAATVNPEDQLPVHIAGYTITEAELPGEVLYWTTQYLSEKQCPPTLMTPLRRIILDEVRVASKKTPNEFGYKSDEAVYIALRLMQAVTARVNDVCLRYLDNARLDTLPPPPPLAQRDLKTVSCATKNSRRVMEDRHVEIGNLEALFGIETTEPTSFYAVYDGHAGSAAATYCAAHLHQYLVESPHFTTDLRRATRDAYLRTDAEFIRKSNQERACGGSTAVTVAVRGRRLLAAWAGDSLALLAKRMRLMQLVRPHKPGRQDERDRIESSGGTVMYWGTWRVNGQLAVSRAIGDAQYKPYVTARPEIATVELDGDEDFVVVACDGLWDFVSEDDVALSVYRQLAVDPDDLKTVTKRLIAQAKRQGSADNISIIVVFLKDPRDIAADNRPPMDLGLDNAMMNVPPFTLETDVCKRQMDAAAAIVEAEVGECIEAEGDVEVGGNGVDNSDSDSEDLGPETAVDADDIDAETRQPEPQPPTPPAHTLEEGHVDGALVDNVAESGEDSEDEWNYYKGEGEREEHNASEEPEEPPRSETPCQDNSAWESSSVDMNSSPLNPDAPVFVPGGVAGADVLLAESPRKPLPMDDIELPDVAQFENEAVVRPAELLDLDNCDQLNGHHNLSLEESVTQHLNGNNKCNMDSLGFGFNVGIEPDKVKDIGLIQDFERIQKDTTDFCNIQVFQTHADTNPFAVDDNSELFERLKNKERDPMSMSFYQEKDDDTCERLVKNDLNVDLNAVQPLPDSDDEDIQQNGLYESEDKENVSPEQHGNSFDEERDFQEPNNDILRFDDRPGDFVAQNVENFGQGDNFVGYNVSNTNNIESYSNIEFESNIIQDTVMQTDTPESHKLLFEQIPEIPDGKSSELGFTNDETQDPSESEKEFQPCTPQDETTQDIEMEISNEESPLVETSLQFNVDPMKDAHEVNKCQQIETESNEVASPTPNGVDIKSYKGFIPEPTAQNIAVDVQNEEEYVTVDPIELSQNINTDLSNVDVALVTPEIKLDTDNLIEAPHVIEDNITSESLLQENSPLPVEALLHSESPLPTESPLPQEPSLPSVSPMLNDSQLPVDEQLSRDSPLPADLSLPSESPLPDDSFLQTENIRESVSPRLKESPLPSEHVIVSPDKLEGLVEDTNHMEDGPSPLPKKDDSMLPSASPMPTDVLLSSQSPMPQESQLPTEIQMTTISPIPSQSPMLSQSPIPLDPLIQTETQLPTDDMPIESPLPINTDALDEIKHPIEPVTSPLPADVPLPGESPLPTDELAVEVDVPVESVIIADTDAVSSEELGESNTVVQSDASKIDLVEAEALLDVDAPVNIYESEEPDVVLTPDMPSVPSGNPVKPEVLLESVKPEAEVNDDELIKSETLVDAESSIETEVPVEVQFLVEAVESVKAEVEIDTHAPVETDITVASIEASAEAECPKEDHAPEIDVTNQSITMAESELKTATSVEAELEPVASVESDVTVEFTPPSEPVATLETETSVDAMPLEISAPLEDTAEHQSVANARTPIPAVPLHTDSATSECMSPPPVTDAEERLTPEVSVERMSSVSAPAPDLLPDEPVPQPRVELITDVDIGIPESRAQEICVPVTSEIQLEEAVQPPTAATPPPTPAVEPSSTTLGAATLSDTPIAAEATLQGVEIAAAAVAAAGAAAGIAAVAKTKSSTIKKSPTAKPDARTAKSAPKTATTRTPTTSTTAKRSTSAAPASRTPTTTKTPSPATKAPISSTRTTPVTRISSATSKPSTPTTKTAVPTAKTMPATKPSPQTRAPATARPAPTKPNGVTAKPAREVPATARAASTTTRAAPAARPAPKTSAPKPDAAPKTSATRPAPRPAPTAAKPPAKTAERKPLPNGDVKDAKAPTRPAVPRPAPTTRPPPRPMPRAPASAPAPATKTSAPKPLPRATPLDKQSKDLANKRITAKAAPPRTAPSKTAALSVKRAVPKKPIESVKKEAEMNGLVNGDAVSKPPPSPPAADNALLPDVIA